MAIQEQTLWKLCCKHKNVVSLQTSLITNDFAFFVMDVCRCSLSDLLVTDPDVDESLETYFRQMLEALEHVHSKGVVHRDIKPANYLVDWDYNIKLCDFGFAISEAALEKEEP